MSEVKRPGAAASFKAGMLGGVIAAVVNLVIFFAWESAVGLIEVPMGPSGEVGPMGAAPVIIATLVPALLACVFYWALFKLVPEHALKIFSIVSLTVLVASFGPVFTLPDAIAGSTAIPLALMHLTAGLLIIGLLLRQAFRGRVA